MSGCLVTLGHRTVGITLPSDPKQARTKVLYAEKWLHLSLLRQEGTCYCAWARIEKIMLENWVTASRWHS